MGTTIQFKRGDSAAIETYFEAAKGEPILNIETGELYVCIDDAGTLRLVNDNTHSTATSIHGFEIDDVDPLDNQILVFNSASNMYTLQYIEDTLNNIDGGSF